HAEARPGARRRDAGAGDVRDTGRGIRPEPGEEVRGRRRPRRQEPDFGDAENPAAQGRAEIRRRRRCAGDRHHARASSPERGAAAEGGGTIMSVRVLDTPTPDPSPQGGGEFERRASLLPPPRNRGLPRLRILILRKSGRPDLRWGRGGGGGGSPESRCPRGPPPPTPKSELRSSRPRSGEGGNLTLRTQISFEAYAC